MDRYTRGRTAPDINTALVAIVPSRRDWELIRTQSWYRLPLRNAPARVKGDPISHLTFSLPSESRGDTYPTFQSELGV